MAIVSNYYDYLIDDNNDPMLDSIKLKAYMDKYDGIEFIDETQLE